MASNEAEVVADFYDIDSLLSRSARVACIYADGTPRDIYDMLGTTAPHFTDEKGYKVFTPFWFVRPLEQKGFCSLTLPMAYNPNVRNVLLAHGEHADLEDAVALAECLLKTMVQRIGGIVLRAIHGNEAPKKMDNLEKKLYEESVRNRDRLLDYFRTQRPSSSRKRRYDLIR
ncbi:unnamed protein product [Cylicocyclus nassatus]|uniref:DNA replication complex GINS protein PSF3 n=1 Tax=Cylicocyclus nassatus TaxID=53992 RepID=A0AA36GIP2_CYLNA|nr:unnamed protein product [Cylicocyclus nassatus]